MESNGNKQRLTIGEPFNPYPIFHNTNRSIYIPEAVVACRRISMKAKLCYGVLCHYADEHDRCSLKRAKLAEILTISERQVRRCITALVDEGCIQVDDGGYLCLK